MEPVPTSLHLGPLTFHTYGLGLAIAAYVAYRYGEARFRRHGLAPERFGAYAIWVLVAGVVGARIAHVATNWDLYSHDLPRMFAVWEGGLSSFGGLALAVPTGWVLARRWWPDATRRAFGDALVPVLIGGWALGRLLGPNFEVAGGGHPTSQWFGLDYAGQVGKRVPVPIIQSLEDGLLLVVLLVLERRFGERLAPGVIAGFGCLVWGVVRTADEHWLLAGGANAGSAGVEIAGLLLAAAGAVILALAVKPPKAAVGD